jgi:hypothetical protein
MTDIIVYQLFITAIQHRRAGCHVFATSIELDAAESLAIVTTITASIITFKLPTAILFQTSFKLLIPFFVIFLLHPPLHSLLIIILEFQKQLIFAKVQLTSN